MTKHTSNPSLAQDSGNDATANSGSRRPRGYTTHGYPAVWAKTMSHEECVEMMNAQISAGCGRKFAVKKPAKVKETSNFGRGFTKHGYPIQWLRGYTHEECMDFLAQNIKPPKSNTRRVKTADTGQIVSVNKSSKEVMTFEVGGHTFEVSSDKHCYTLSFRGRTTYYGMFSELLAAVRQALIRHKLAESAKEGMITLSDMIAAERSATAAVLSWDPSAGYNSSLG